jgi:arylsulfatase A-like enzyme
MIVSKIAALFCLLTLSLAAKQPNILLIQVDDLGYDDLCYHGNTSSQTPNLDRLAESSVRFRNFMVNSVCAPTRASMLTGRDFLRTGCEGLHGGKEFLHLDERTFGNVFQDAGYATGMWGKWHNGKADGYWPWDRGFDEAYFADLYQYFPSSGWYNEYQKKTVHKDEWSPTVLADYTIDFISKKKDRPFLAYLSFLTCHSTWNAPEKYRSKYEKMGHSEHFATLLGMLEYMDEETGRVLQHLTDLGLDDDTIVLFMSDNGPNKGGSMRKKGTDVITDDEWQLRNNHGYLGSKSRLWQNGIKSPLFVRWPDKYTPADVDRLVTITDIFPTLLDIAKIPLPANNPPLDGRSVKSYLEGDTKALDEKHAVFARWFPAWEGDHYDPIQDKTSLDFNAQKLTLLTERYKYIQNEHNVPGSPKPKNGVVLIDLKNDPLEGKNIASAKPRVARAMRQELEGWFNDLIQAPHSFTHTVFQIGWEGKKVSEILAFGPSKTEGTKNQSHAVTQWDKPGDYAEYRINVHHAGVYEVSITCFNGKPNRGMKLMAVCEGNSTQAALDGSRAPSLGQLKLDVGEHVLKLVVVSPAKGKGKSLSIKAIKLERQ